MPELPEVETVVRGLRPGLLGRTVAQCRIHCEKTVRGADPELWRRIAGTTIRAVRRRGKVIVIESGDDFVLLIHLKMTGRLFLAPHAGRPDAHTRFVLRFGDERSELRFHDVRKFGYVRCLPAAKEAGSAEVKDLGPDPLDLDFPSFRDLIRKRKGRLKSLLLNQRVVAGIGNIYADEILHRSGLHPLSPANALDENGIRTLWASMRHVLRRAIALHGSSIRDYRDAEGKEGGFQNLLRVYGREARPCRRCGTAIDRIRIGGRSSYFCPGCQKRKPERKQDRPYLDG